MLLISVAVDLVHGVGLAVSIVRQTQYLPRPLGSCSQVSDFANITSIPSNVFEVLAKTNGSTPQAQCQPIAAEFRFAMALMYALPLCQPPILLVDIGY